ncbi:RNA-binding S4 domain-containing protein [Cohaesibacter celericrescens]|uniref:RNA-binding protein n=1 Tax=Cohaesibacter celericrescens TaxID=2067669 RepID=A0A2N5XUI5_9HYPH|nr:RNA-binding S4 domain-containing protein [Cohaesibacter celericrescens]PLW78105.1 RNA-binding protein [Cohaesibacter celericrescens]
MNERTAKLRIDKWLWYARVAKTRSLAAKLVTSGCVRLNKDKVTSASQGIKVEDVLTVTRASHVLVYKVVQLGSRRGPAPEAQLLFEDLTPKPEPGADKSAPVSLEAGHGRPSKKDRRDIMRLKRSFMDE